MSGHRLLRILGELTVHGGVEPTPTRLCEVCASITITNGAAVTVMWRDRSESPIGASDDVSALLDDLQYTLGEGPGVDAYRTLEPVFEADLADPAAARWLAFSPAAVEAGARAVFAFPLGLGAVRLGALTLYRRRAGRLDDEQHADALVMADVTAHALLAMQAGAPIEVLADDLATGVATRAVVHQAAGMTSVHLGIGVGDALVRLRTFAFSTDQQLDDLARGIVEGRLRLDARGDGRHE